MKLYLKLDGDTIISHDYYEHDDFITEIEEKRLVNFDGDYIYKYSGDALVALSEAEITAHPNKIKSARLDKLNGLYKNEKSKLVWKEVKKDMSLDADDIAEIDAILAGL